MADDNERRIFAKNLNYYIALNGKQQNEVAKAIGENPSTLNMWCKGNSIPGSTPVIYYCVFTAEKPGKPRKYAIFLPFYRIYYSTIFCHRFCHRFCHGDGTKNLIFFAKTS